MREPDADGPAYQTQLNDEALDCRSARLFGGFRLDFAATMPGYLPRLGLPSQFSGNRIPLFVVVR